MRAAPQLLSKIEQKELLELSENIWHDLQQNNLGGYSDGNRPFYILTRFKYVIEKYGNRDIGQTWTQEELNTLKGADNET